jgi:hypothetical protein
MSYAIAAALQTAVFQALGADPVLGGLVGSDIYDALPSGLVPDLYISLGPEEAKDASDKTHAGAIHQFTVSVTSTQPGFTTCKTVAGAVCDVLVDAELTLSRGNLISLSFEKASATRIDAGNSRQIDLRFAARVEDS